MTYKNEVGISKSDIWEAVIESGVLGSSKNQSALFKYLLDYSFDETRPDITTKDIAAKVFGRNGDFNTKKDSIVRVEMHRLRANLESFNEQSEPLKIELPKSSYLLKIAEARSNKPHELVDTIANTGRGKNRLLGGALMASIAAIIFIFTGAITTKNKGEDCSIVMPNLEIAAPADDTDLSQYVHQVVSGAASQFKHFNSVRNVEACGTSQVPGYKLTYALFERDEGFQGSLSITSQASGKIVGIGDLSGSAPSAIAKDGELYYTLARITNDLLQPSGVVHRDAVSQSWNNHAHLEDYSCLVKMYDSFASDTDEDYYEAFECLKTAHAKGSSSLENLGALAASYLEQVQGNRVADSEDAFKQAEMILNDIGENWQQSPETTAAKIMYDSVRKDYNVQQIKETLLRAEKTYTSHPLVLLDIARYSGFMLGEWEKAIDVMGKVKRLMSDQDNSVYQVEAAFALLSENSSLGWKNCLNAYSEHSKVSNLIVHACALKYNNADWTDRTTNNLIDFNLLELPERQAFIENMGFEPAISAALMVY